MSKIEKKTEPMNNEKNNLFHKFRCNLIVLNRPLKYREKNMKISH